MWQVPKQRGELGRDSSLPGGRLTALCHDEQSIGETTQTCLEAYLALFLILQPGPAVIAGRVCPNHVLTRRLSEGNEKDLVVLVLLSDDLAVDI
jgi:hypothetical protein